MRNLPTEESFLKDVAEHKMTILLDNDLYRHIRFSKPQSSNMYFDLITGPGFLLYRGDMGTYEFERLPDMFEFFRTDREYNQKQGRKLSINTGYWAEKCQAVSNFGNGIKEFSEDVFRENLERAVASYLEGDDDIDEGVFRGEVESEILNHMDMDDGNAIRLAMEFEFGGEYPFHDFYEYSCQKYTYHYIWCCYAMAWGIEQYDLSKEIK